MPNIDELLKLAHKITVNRSGQPSYEVWYDEVKHHNALTTFFDGECTIEINFRFLNKPKLKELVEVCVREGVDIGLNDKGEIFISWK